MKWGPRDFVAIILTFTVMLFMLSNTSFGFYFLDSAPPEKGREVIVEAWLNLINVLIGGLIGYVVGNGAKP